MAFAQMATRVLLAVTALSSLIAAWPVAFGTKGVTLLKEDPNEWSGLLGLLVAGSAAIAAAGVLASRWVLAHPLGVAFAGIPLVALVLIRFSQFDSSMMLSWALVGALCALVAALMQPGLFLLTQIHEKRTVRTAV
ncbi:hypothetical protein ACF046_13260 [Glutamicibacter creatinolyticus]|uniref:hypothetical protein n=1 Tax=Glutamicibacter creatinolyticus TaxID=162496 RepID=UPI00340A6E4A